MKTAITPFIYSLVIGSMLFVGCGDDDINIADFNGERTTQLVNTFDHGVLPAHDRLVNAVEQLEQDLETLTTTPDAQNLAAAQEQWRQTTQIWKACELYAIGDIGDSFIRFRLQRWPIDIEGIEEQLATSEMIDENFVASRGSSVIGLSTIEYLLFNPEDDTILQKLSLDTQYSAYLLALGQFLSTQAKTLQADWSAYGSTFTTSDGLGLDGGQNMLANSLVFFLEESIILRLGKPLGQKDDGVLQPADLEAPYAEESLIQLEAGLQEWERMYLGDYAGSATNYGFEDMLVELGYEQLDQSIKEATQNCYTALQSFTNTNARAALTERMADLEALQEDLRALLVLIKVDLGSNLSIVVTPNDLDGD
ncbi:MAG: imelysin family protein [Bacteroidota bacterium]